MLIGNVVDFTNIDVVYLQYNPERDPSKPMVQFEGSCLVGLNELHGHFVEKQSQRMLMEKNAYKHYVWYNGILQEELYEAPYGYQLQVFHWSIESGIKAAFYMRGFQFNVLSMIIGPDMEYWFGINLQAKTSFTKRGRYYRAQPSSPCDQYRYMLPKCPIVMASCNCCDQYFLRSAKKEIKSGSSEQFRLSSIECLGTINGGIGNGTNSTDSLKRNCDKQLFHTICQETTTAMTIDCSGCSSASTTDDDDDEVEEDSSREILFFKISMCKFRRTKETTYAETNKNKLNIRLRAKILMTIAEEAEE